MPSVGPAEVNPGVFVTWKFLFYTSVLNGPTVLGEGEVYNLAGRRTQWLTLLVVSVPVLAVLATWLTGLWQNSSLGYGFPLAWNECYFLALPTPQGGRHCYFNQTLFLLDAAFYTIIGYTIALLYYRPPSRHKTAR